MASPGLSTKRLAPAAPSATTATPVKASAAPEISRSPIGRPRKSHSRMQDHDRRAGVDQRRVGRRRVVEAEIDDAAADEHAEESEGSDDRRLGGRSPNERRSRRPAKGRTIRNAPSQRRNASVHGATSRGDETADHHVRGEKQRHKRNQDEVASPRRLRNAICRGMSFPMRTLCGNARGESGQGGESLRVRPDDKGHLRCAKAWPLSSPPAKGSG